MLMPPCGIGTGKAPSNPSRPATRCFIPSMKCARRLDNAPKSYELMENPILFPLGIFPASVRHIVESLQKYEHYEVDFTAVSFFTAFTAAMGNTWSAVPFFMWYWLARPAAARHHRCVRR